MKALGVDDQIDLNNAIDRVERVVRSLEKLDESTRANEDISVARARLQNWLDENAGRWVG